MSHKGLRNVMLVVMAASAAAIVDAEQVRRGAQADTVTVQISLKAGGQSVSASGPGKCTHAPQASIYGVMSEMWSVRHQDGDKATQLTLWRPKDGKDAMFSLSLNGGPTIDISTVRGGTVTGSGTVKLQPNGKGGRFTIDAKSKSGEAVTGTIECPAFTAAVAEGG